MSTPIPATATDTAHAPRVVILDHATAAVAINPAGEPGWLQRPAAADLSSQLAALDLSHCRVLCLATPLAVTQAESLAQTLAHLPAPPVLLLHATGAASAPPVLQPFLRYHHSQRLPAASVHELIARLLASMPLSSAAPAEQWQELAQTLNQQRDWHQALATLAHELPQLVNSAHGHIVTWSDAADTPTPAAAVVCATHETGITGFVRHSAQPAVIPSLAADPRFATTDLPQTSDDSGLIATTHADDEPGNAAETAAAPSPTATAETASALFLPLATELPAPAVLCCYRDADHPPFNSAEAHRLQHQLLSLHEPLSRLWSAHRQHLASVAATPGLNSSLYRREAIQQLVDGEVEEDHVLADRDRLTQWTYRILVGGLIGLLAYLCLGRIHEYAVGPAVVRAAGRSELTAPGTGAVSEILVTPGQSVTAGQRLLVLHQGQQLAELRQLEQEFQARLRQRLLNPDDPQLEAVLINLRSQLTLARAKLAERTINAPRAGTIGDVLVRQGQYVNTGRPLLTLAHNSDSRSLVALIPGDYRPQLQPGMTLRMELNGYPYDYQQLTISQVDNQVIGPQQARFYLGTAIGDALAIDGPLVMVHADLPSHFSSRDGQQYSYHDGMQGTVEVRLRSEPIIFRLMPALKGLGADE